MQVVARVLRATGGYLSKNVRKTLTIIIVTGVVIGYIIHGNVESELLDVAVGWFAVEPTATE